MFGHNNFDYTSHTVFAGEVTTTKPVKWTRTAWSDSHAPNWGTDTRSWEYEGYTITQTTKKQVHEQADKGNDWYKYQTTTTATDADGEIIHEIVRGETEYAVSWGNKINSGALDSNLIDKHINADGNAMQVYLDDYEADPNGDSNGDNKDDSTNGDDNGDDEPKDEEVKTIPWLLYGLCGVLVLYAFTA